MKTTDGEIGDRTRPEGGVVPQAVQEANAMKARREAQAAATTDDETTDGPPAKSAKKDEWVSYAGTLGIDTDGMSVAQIQEAVEGHQAE